MDIGDEVVLVHRSWLFGNTAEPGVIAELATEENGYVIWVQLDGTKRFSDRVEIDLLDLRETCFFRPRSLLFKKDYEDEIDHFGPSENFVMRFLLWVANTIHPEGA